MALVAVGRVDLEVADARWAGWLSRRVEEDLVGDAGVELLQNPQVGFGIVAFAKAGDDHALHLGQVLDDAPGREGVSVGHG